jgi:ABC-type lipoprotein release transport system permease subunit
MPLLGGVAMAVVTSVAVTKMFFAAASTQSFDGRPVPIPVSPFVRVCVFAVLATGLAALCTFPSISRAIRPESLRTE